MTPERQEPYDGRPSRTVLWEPGNHGSRATRLRAGIPVAAKNVFIYLHGWRQLSGVSDVPLGQSVSFRLPQGGGIRVYPRRRNTREELTILITHFFHESDQTYRCVDVSTQPWPNGESTQAQIWCASSCTRPAWWPASPEKRARTTIPAQDLGYRPDLVKRNFTANKPEQKRDGRGQSSSPTWEGFTYLATVMDCDPR